jgi:hypothetical protein
MLSDKKWSFLVTILLISVILVFLIHPLNLVLTENIIESIYSGSKVDNYFVFLFFSLGYSRVLINISSALLLYFITDENKNRLYWAGIGIFFGILGVIFFLSIYVYTRKANIVHNFNIKTLSTIVFIFLTVSFATEYYYIYNFLMIDEHSPGRFFSSFKHLSKQKDIIENASNFFLNIFLAIWSYFCINKTTKNRKDTTINTLFALFFGLKGIILMVLYDLLRESRLEKQLE